MSWAAIAKAVPVKAEPAAEPSESQPRVAVLDANALITQHGILNLVRPACMRAMRSCSGRRRRRRCLRCRCCRCCLHPFNPCFGTVPLQVRFADKCVTTPEVLREVRDKQSRATLAALPFAIETREPAEDSVKAGEVQLLP